MKHFNRIPWGLLTTILFAATAGSSADTQFPSAVIVRITGPAWLIAGSRMRLDPQFDVGRILYSGQRLVTHCSKGRMGCLVIQYVTGERVSIPNPGHPDYTVQWRSPKAPGAFTAAVEQTHRLAGRSRPGEMAFHRALVFSPAQGGFVDPDRFEFRWVPWKGSGTLSLQIDALDGQQPWSFKGVSLSSGYLVSPSARRFLREHQKDAAAVPVRLVVSGLDAQEVEVLFSVLSAQSEAAMERELAALNRRGADLLMRHLSRAEIFSRYGLANEAADEYDAVLQSAPYSESLLKADIELHGEIGDFGGMNSLKHRLRRHGSASAGSDS